jgi:hypothetical protein
MSRSIHTVWRDLDAARERAHAGGPADDHARLRAELERKRRVKRSVAAERRRGPRPPEPPPGPALVRARDAGECVHFLATERDVREVLRLLPPGTTDGLVGVDLGLGAETQREHLGGEPGTPDPLVGRYGVEILPGVYCGHILGRYRPAAAHVELYAYVYAPDVPFRPVAEAYLRLRQLATLLHEVGHHHDSMSRVARGKWRADDDAKNERYARAREHAWVREVAAPYLERTYPAEVAALAAFLARHGGVALPLAELADDPARGVPVFTMAEALSTLFELVARGEPPSTTQVEFARELHYQERYARARQALAAVRAREPACLGALVLEADIDVHERAFERAEALCREVIARAPAVVEAWQVLVDAAEGRHRWAEARDAATRVLDLVDDGWPRRQALENRARAAVELGEAADAAADLDELDRSPLSRDAAASLRALLALRVGDAAGALAVAAKALPEARGTARAVLAAAGFEAAHRLGRPADAPALPAAWRERLRQANHGPWVARLEATWGDRLEGPGQTVRRAKAGPKATPTKA